MTARLKLDEALSLKLESELQPSPRPERPSERNDSQEVQGRGKFQPGSLQPSLTSSRFSRAILSNLFRKHSILIVALTLISLVLGGYGISSLKDQYTATVLLMLDQSGSRLLGPDNPPPLNVDGEAEILKSENVALRVVDDLNLISDPDYNQKPGVLSYAIAKFKEALVSILQGLGLRSTEQDIPPLSDLQSSSVRPLSPEKAAVLQLLKQNITIRRRGLTDLLAVEAKAGDPRRAALIANAYAQAYLDEQVAVKEQALTKAEKILARQLAELNEELKRSEAQIGLRQSYQESATRLRAIAQRRETLSADARIVSPARPPRGPTFPSARLLGVLGIVFSAVVGLGLAFAAAALKETNLRRAYSVEDVEAASGVPNLAVIPRQQSRLRRRRVQAGGIVPEAIRKLLFSMQLLDQKGGRSTAWMVTSTHSNENEAQLGVMLARLAGASGLKTVVIDCNLRSPHIHEILSTGNDKGFADLLISQIDAQSVIQDDFSESYKFMAAGAADEYTIEKCFRSDRLRNAMRKLRLDYDLIVLVAPPIEHSADPLMLMSVVDGALFVVQSGEITLSDIRSSVHQLSRSGEGRIYTILSEGQIGGQDARM